MEAGRYSDSSTPGGSRPDEWKNPHERATRTRDDAADGTTVTSSYHKRQVAQVLAAVQPRVQDGVLRQEPLDGERLRRRAPRLAAERVAPGRVLEQLEHGLGQRLG